MRKRLLSLAAAAVLAGTLTACSSGGGSDLSADESPLSAYLSALYGGSSGMSTEELQKQSDEENVRIEELIAACMQEQGFEYTPNPQSSSVVFSSDEDWDPESRDWVEKYGYGVFNDPWADQEMPVDDAEYVDPNEDYVAALSESEQLAYSEALNGDSPTEEQMNDPEFDWNTLDSGCYGSAADEVYGFEDSDDLYEQFEPLITRIDELSVALETSEGVVELDAAWASCMADAGHAGYAAQADAVNELYDKQNAFYEDQSAAYEDVDWESMSDDDIVAFDEATSPQQSEEWKKAAEDEITLALDDLECREKVDYNDEKLRLQFDAEEQFIADNKADLDALVAAAEQAG